MAAGLASNGDDVDEHHEINVTPFIDVMLVLLIIFMVAAPLSTVDVHVDLPSSTAPATPRSDKPVTLTIRSDLTVAIGQITAPKSEIGSRLDAATGGDKSGRILVRADKSVPYGDLTDLMNVLRAAGYARVGLVGLKAGEPTPPTRGAP